MGEWYTQDCSSNTEQGLNHLDFLSLEHACYYHDAMVTCNAQYHPVAVWYKFVGVHRAAVGNRRQPRKNAECRSSLARLQ